MKKTLILSALFLLAFTGVFAQRYEYPGQRYPASNNDRRDSYAINDMQREARRRIAMGIDNETLSPGEAIRLLDEYDRIQARERKFRSNRNLTNRETRELTNDLENLLRKIRYENRDGQRAGNNAPPMNRRGW
ncbi:hypothetical protein [Telluribacter sp.]|jgi:hypothetical protein|uniref:hypothetical protein n=1 Tax=Telluribacter sp. TaxID=1978767 RepID=UPI002E103978|nr:hypothetical protein [Telluribacter sp.]